MNLCVNQDLLTETSAALYQATEQRVFFKNIDILLPSKWKNATQEITPTITRM